jgi:hypothetical protein
MHAYAVAQATRPWVLCLMQEPVQAALHLYVVVHVLPGCSVPDHVLQKAPQAAAAAAAVTAGCTSAAMWTRMQQMDLPTMQSPPEL